MVNTEEGITPVNVKNSAIVFIVGFVVLHIGGMVFFSSLTWGFNYFKFLPILLTGSMLGGGMLLSLFILKGSCSSAIKKLAEYMELYPVLFFCCVTAVFILASILFQVKAPLLGDSFVIIKNYENQLMGTKELWAFRSPLAVHYIFAWMKIFDTVTYPAMLTAFLVGEIILGIGLLLNIFLIVREVFIEPVQRLTAFLFLTTLPYIQLFFGYVEVYAVFLFALSVLVYVIILYMKEKTSFYLVTVAYLFSLFAHFLTLILAPAMLYLIYLVYKRNKYKVLAISTASIAGLFLIVLAASNFEVKRFLIISKYSYFLTFAPSNLPYQAYTVFSLYHCSEIINLLILLCPVPLFLLAVVLIKDRKIFLNSHETRFFSMAVITIVLFIFFIRFDLGVAKDWDVSSSFVLLIALLSLIAIFRLYKNASVIVISLVISTMAVTVPWFYLNSTRDESVQRMESLFDTRILSSDSYYLATQHIARYYTDRGDIQNVQRTLDRYLHQYPRNTWVWKMNVEVLGELLGQTHPAIENIYHKWLEAVPSDSDAQRGLASYLMNRGTEFLNHGLMDQAKKDIEAAAVIDSAYKGAPTESGALSSSESAINENDKFQKLSTLNNLGLVYYDKGDYREALEKFKQAINIESTYVPAYVNCANAYLADSKPDTAIRYYLKALTFDKKNISALENLSKAYYRIGNTEMAFQSLRLAARLGSKTAQSLLTQSGKQW